MTSIVCRQELISRISNLLESSFDDGEAGLLIRYAKDQGLITLQFDIFELFVLLNDLCYVKRTLNSVSPSTLKFRGKRLGDNNSEIGWVLDQYNWKFPAPNAELEVTYE